MAKRPDAKSQLLREHGMLNPRPQLVSDGLFQDSEFFDPHDLLLVKYEMLRRVSLEELTVTEAAAAFGFSRPSFYQAQSLYEEGGLAGLIPSASGAAMFRPFANAEILQIAGKSYRLTGGNADDK